MAEPLSVPQGTSLTLGMASSGSRSRYEDEMNSGTSYSLTRRHSYVWKAPASDPQKHRPDPSTIESWCVAPRVSTALRRAVIACWLTPEQATRSRAAAAQTDGFRLGSVTIERLLTRCAEEMPAVDVGAALTLLEETPGGLRLADLAANLRVPRSSVERALAPLMNHLPITDGRLRLATWLRPMVEPPVETGVALRPPAGGVVSRQLELAR